jgi:hypothetical protein
LTTLIELPIVGTTLVLNTNVFNVVTQLTLNGIAPSTFVEHVIRLLQDMHLGHAEDMHMMMEFMDITTLMDMKMEILLESVNLCLLFAYIYFS